MICTQKAQIEKKKIISKNDWFFRLFSKNSNITGRFYRNFVIINFWRLWDVINAKKKNYDLHTKGTKYEILKKKFVKIWLIFRIFVFFGRFKIARAARARGYNFPKSLPWCQKIFFWNLMCVHKRHTIFQRSHILIFVYR